MSGWRDLGCGEPRPEHVDRTATLAGWAARRRDHGGLVFVDLRDETGVCQLVVNPANAAEAAKVAHDVRNEFVLQATGTIVARAPETVNPSMPTGEVELQVYRARACSRPRRRCRSSSTRRASTRRCASATAGSTCGASGSSATSGCARR